MNNDVEEVCREDFREQLKMDAAEELAEGRKEAAMHKDYDLFVDNHQAEFEAFEDALIELKRLHEQFGHEFDCRDI